ncbi:hypothetical protein BM613_10960 [Sulfoacidibacillus thermotolerans]|uniref:Uncharacterized protein n=1 Tax=Sulfoacidibacillus thermotolerans TaxID=1765684 RepID=A0A2U3D6T7_SULT2|nr:hypothetical protein BM613_10960 [Sulfoacidibacillus thermotolerans]
MSSLIDASIGGRVCAPASPIDPAPAMTIVFQHRNLVLRVTSNKPSAAAVESFRSALYPLVKRLADPTKLTR